MAGWFAPIFKAVAPHLGTIVSAVIPSFTKKKPTVTAEQIQVLQDQVSELQTAASQNTEYIKSLAADLQKTVSALEQAGQLVEGRLKFASRLAGIACILAVAALIAALWR